MPLYTPRGRERRLSSHFEIYLPIITESAPAKNPIRVHENTKIPRVGVKKKEKEPPRIKVMYSCFSFVLNKIREFIGVFFKEGVGGNERSITAGLLILHPA